MGSVQSVERAFAVLRCLSGGPAGVTDIAERVDLPKSTVSRLLATLQELGAVEQLDSGGEYQIGAALGELAGSARPGTNLLLLARPHLVELSNQLDEATGLSVLDRQEVYYIDQVDTDHAVQVRDWTGERIPLHVVPSGLVLLAAEPRSVRDRYLAKPLTANTAHSITDADELRRRLDRVAAAGVEWVYEEFAEGINSVAAAVRGAGGATVAAVHAHGPSYRFPGERDPYEIAALVRVAAERIGDRLA